MCRIRRILTALDRFAVSGGSFTANVPARNAIAIHIGAMGSATATVIVNFAETATTNFGEVSEISDHFSDHC